MIFGITKKSKTVRRADYDALIGAYGELEAELNQIKADIEPMKAFMQEHAKTILEAEEEYARQQKLRTDGIQNILAYDYAAAMNKV